MRSEKERDRRTRPEAGDGICAVEIVEGVCGYREEGRWEVFDHDMERGRGRGRGETEQSRGHWLARTGHRAVFSYVILTILLFMSSPLP